MPISLTNRTRRPTPRAAFAKIAAEALGKDYELSLVLCGNALSRKLNSTYRDKDYPTNVLSFPISKKAGEIFINLAKLGEFSVPELFIHGLFHLNGMQHGRKMEEAEKALLNESKRRRWY